MTLVMAKGMIHDALSFERKKAAYDQQVASMRARGVWKQDASRYGESDARDSCRESYQGARRQSALNAT